MPDSQPKPTSSPQLEGGTYEIIRNRLAQQQKALQNRLKQLNESRKAVFGAIETKLIANERINTLNNCIAADIMAIGDTCLLGYNVHFGLRTEIKLEDVFSIYTFTDQTFHAAPIDLIDDATFKTDFRNLYKYYRDASFVKFAQLGNYLHMVFQVGESVKDIKTFKWLIKDNKLSYIDNRSEHEFQFPPQHAFKWVRAHRDHHRDGQHPHVSVLDRVFVECVNGDLTIKIEDNTDTGEGILSEPVKYKDQTLDDADYFYADLGNLIVLKIRPYQETFRYFIYNDKVREVRRIDALEDAGILLPDQQGLIFSNGFYLQTGEYKLFDQRIQGIKFQQVITAPNGEDFLYVFYNEPNGLYMLLSYNIIDQQVKTPITCHGFVIFKEGQLCYFKTDDDATRHHVIQIWQTAFSQEVTTTEEHKENYLYKVGNKEIVRAMAECYGVITLLNKEDGYDGLYDDLQKQSTDIIDAYYWLGNKETYNLQEPLSAIKETASAAITEFEKVQQARKNTASQLKTVEESKVKLLKQVGQARYQHINQYVEALSSLRLLQGEIISLKDLRYIDISIVDQMQENVRITTTEISTQAVAFLLKDAALQPYIDNVAAIQNQISETKTVAEGKTVTASIDKIGTELEMLIDIVSNLQIDDATQSTKIIDHISTIYSRLNQTKASLKQHIKALFGHEAQAAFKAQLKLIDQGIVNYLDLADTPEKCDESLTKLMIQLEELEGKFAEFDEFIGQLTDKREELYTAFESKKLQITEARNKRAVALQNAADRILAGVKNKATQFSSAQEINSYFAADLMIVKIRDIIEQLQEINDAVKAEDISSKLKVVQEDALRQLRDKQDLFVDGEDIIKLGQHHFTVNTQPLDLTMVLRNGAWNMHLTGTDFFLEIADDILSENEAIWERTLPSESSRIYRAEYLAYQVFKQLDASILPDKTLASSESEAEFKSILSEHISNYMASHYDEGYSKGVHDNDSLHILTALVALHQHIDLLKYEPAVRSLVALAWQFELHEDLKASWKKQLEGANILLQVFPDSNEFDYLLDEFQLFFDHQSEFQKLFKLPDTRLAARYLFDELSRSQAFIISRDANLIYQKFRQYIRKRHVEEKLKTSLDHLVHVPVMRFMLAKKWVEAFIRFDSLQSFSAVIDEVAVLLLTGHNTKNVKETSTTTEVQGMLGNHPILDHGKYSLDYNKYLSKLRWFTKVEQPQFVAFQQRKKELAKQFKQQLRLDEFKPRVLSSFVRNKLIDQVYLPIFGENLAKQIGTAGDSKRSDRMGMLLLISPPGYGKTTLMEYISSRLGLIFMKINGPALGHSTTSLDPDECTNATARQELQKLNLALEMGDNIMLYLDDIQHCDPEFLQKFISLCDGQRKIEGVYNGVTKTYDFRGKRVCVVMAGNPYTESGEKFTIPDMLANRADTYNLGDILGDSDELFKLSLIENSLTANPLLQVLATKSFKDVYTLIGYAQTGNKDDLTFEANHTQAELNDYVKVFEKIIAIRNVVHEVNQLYISSAGMADEYRTEPPFKLQGSYRDMNKLVAKVVPVMNDAELQTMLLSHYENESQTLTTGAEANLLRFKILANMATENEQERWEAILKVFRKQQQLRGIGNKDGMAQVVAQLSNFTEGIEGIEKALREGIQWKGFGKDS